MTVADFIERYGITRKLLAADLGMKLEELERYERDYPFFIQQNQVAQTLTPIILREVKEPLPFGEVKAISINDLYLEGGK